MSFEASKERAEQLLEAYDACWLEDERLADRTVPASREELNAMRERFNAARAAVKAAMRADETLYDNGMQRALASTIDRLQQRIAVLEREAEDRSQYVSHLEGRVAELEALNAEAQAFVEQAELGRASAEPKPPHLREPPHCSSCACGMPTEPPPAAPKTEDIELCMTWLRSALDCKSWVWDTDQRLAAEGCLIGAAEEMRLMRASTPQSERRQVCDGQAGTCLTCGVDLVCGARTAEPPAELPIVPWNGGYAIRPTHEAADAFWKYWRENGETHRHGYYESTWGAINQALRAAVTKSDPVAELTAQAQAMGMYDMRPVEKDSSP